MQLKSSHQVTTLIQFDAIGISLKSLMVKDLLSLKL